jgi:hypothetical protein
VMVMLVWHTEITMRHKDKAILYWFGPPESKTLHPVLRFVLLALRDYMTTCPREDALARCCGGGGGVSKNPEGFPEHEHGRESVVNTFKRNSKEEGDLRSPNYGSNSQNSESIYTCPRAPFYRETKGLLHS